MKLTQIALRNFRSGQNLVLDTDAPRIYICGDNGVGKSSIREAIRWTLRGVCQATDAKGLGWQAIVPEGTTVLEASVNVAEVSRAILPLFSVERKYEVIGNKRSLHIDGRDNGGVGSTQESVLGLLQTTPEFLDAVLETDYFIRLGHADAKAMVLGLLNVRIPVAGEESLTLAQVESRYQDAFKARTEAKAKLRGHVVPSAPVGDAYDVAEIDARIKELQGELDGLLSQGGQTKGKRQILEHQLEAAKARVVLQVPEDPTARIEQLTEALRQWNHDEAVFNIGSRSPEASDANSDLIDRLTKHQPTKGCVLDPHVPCDTHKNKFTNRVKFLKSLDVSQTKTPESSISESTFDPFRGAQISRELIALAETNRQRNHALTANTQRQSDIDALQAQLNSLPPEVAVDNGAAVETLRARIEKGQKVRDKAKEYWDSKGRFDKAYEVKQKLEAEVSRLEVLCEVLGPNGVRVQALKAAIDQFESAINQRTEAFGWTVKFDLEPWTVMVNGRPVDAYSESEQFRIGLAIQMAVAEASGLGFLVVDRLDMLLVANRKIVNQMLLKPNPAIQQIIILASREPEDPLPHAEGVKAFRLSLNGHNRTVIAETT